MIKIHDIEIVQNEEKLPIIIIISSELTITLLQSAAAGVKKYLFSPNLLQMNSLMRKKNIRTLRMKWTRRSLNYPGSKWLKKLAGANTVLGRAWARCLPFGWSLLYAVVWWWAVFWLPPASAVEWIVRDGSFPYTRLLLRTDLTDGLDAPPFNNNNNC